MIKTLMKSIREYRQPTLLASGLMVLEVVMEVLIPFFMAMLIDKGISQGDMSYVTKMGTILIGMACLSLLFGCLSGSAAATAATGFSTNLRHDIFSQIQRFSFANIDNFSSDSLVTRLTTDISNVLLAYQAIIRQAVRAICMVCFTLFLVYTISVKIGLMFTVVVPLLGGLLFYIAKKAHPYFMQALATYDQLNNVVQENLQGIRVVKSFVKEDVETDKFTTISLKICQAFTKGQKIVAYNMPTIQFFTYLCILVIAWIGAHLIVSNELTTGNFMSMFAYVMQILMNLMLLSVVFVQIIIARSSAERIVEVLQEEPDQRVAKQPVMTVADGAIRFNHVNFSYVKDQTKLCLIDANLTIASGETIGIVGGTGSSKTTLVQLIPRLYDATTGSVSIGGRDVGDYDIDVLRNEVAMVPQNNLLFSGTIKENLLWGNPKATEQELVHACQLAQADEFIQQLSKGYDTFIEEGGTNVSGGQRQRLCIARALLKKPKVLILDDSTSAVDTKTDGMIRRAFREEILATTKLIIAQRISSIQEADRIIVLEGGQVNGIGTHDELLASNQIYQEIYHTQIQGGGDFDEA
ncbi:ABC transporter ATP-binding protein [Vagococcus sp. BWB3-3]|uniref:ABC transporter ATP-binding protein n=1 Tax=Vagococcus allomyrinae TaxID=2794353 RepID=A0A940PED0_9ENTE|nr:ABC transporter ATP-binding protein [Vagococcus allomyrinae]MBP1044491.1 ABC transporter ATP-binding protein [Vagococcus allomyrinae]